MKKSYVLYQRLTEMNRKKMTGVFFQLYYQIICNFLFKFNISLFINHFSFCRLLRFSTFFFLLFTSLIGKNLVEIIQWILACLFFVCLLLKAYMISYIRINWGICCNCRFLLLGQTYQQSLWGQISYIYYLFTRFTVDMFLIHVKL